ncbi:hypothetical protein KLP40_14405 [Hymenobacter sp. NST-14]|uniref:hypothetical protein n=1 Tax=Hymenobacter piscis TaxID=2839984 RepID=UPI001C00D6AC|nr:hypothetical protein [Hymenobacter piscis]MBT9394359.1 hypothetical protein [Hymenobacter piscis]
MVLAAITATPIPVLVLLAGIVLALLLNAALRVLRYLGAILIRFRTWYAGWRKSPAPVKHRSV